MADEADQPNRAWTFRPGPAMQEFLAAIRPAIDPDDPNPGVYVGIDPAAAGGITPDEVDNETSDPDIPELVPVAPRYPSPIQDDESDPDMPELEEVTPNQWIDATFNWAELIPRYFPPLSPTMPTHQSSALEPLITDDVVFLLSSLVTPLDATMMALTCTHWYGLLYQRALPQGRVALIANAFQYGNQGQILETLHLLREFRPDREVEKMYDGALGGFLQRSMEGSDDHRFYLRGTTDLSQGTCLFLPKSVDTELWQVAELLMFFRLGRRLSREDSTVIFLKSVQHIISARSILSIDGTHRNWLSVVSPPIFIWIINYLRIGDALLGGLTLSIYDLSEMAARSDVPNLMWFAVGALIPFHENLQDVVSSLTSLKMWKTLETLAHSVWHNGHLVCRTRFRFPGLEVGINLLLHGNDGYIMRGRRTPPIQDEPDWKESLTIALLDQDNVTAMELFWSLWKDDNTPRSANVQMGYDYGILKDRIQGESSRSHEILSLAIQDQLTKNHLVTMRSFFEHLGADTAASIITGIFSMVSPMWLQMFIIASVSNDMRALLQEFGVNLPMD